MNRIAFFLRVSLAIRFSFASTLAVLSGVGYAGTTPSTTSLNALSPAGSVAYGATRTYTGTVSPAASTGTVEVRAGTVLVCSASLTGTTTKTYSCTSGSVPNAGTHSITAKYLGDTTYNVSSSAARSQTITKINPTTVGLLSSPASPTANAAFKLTATVTVRSGTTPTGTVNFRRSATSSIANCAAVTLSGVGTTKTAECSVIEPTVGTKTYNALYSGDDNFNSGTNPNVNVTVVAATTTATSVSSTGNSVVYPNRPTLTATITPSTVNVGTVTFKQGAADVPGCTNLAVPTTGSIKTVTCTPPLTNVGTYTYTANYGGGTGFTASSGTSPSIAITKAAPTNVAVTSDTATPTTTVAFTLTTTVTTAAGTAPTGTVNFRNSSNASLSNCGAVSLTGTGVTKTATCSVVETTTGSKSYNVVYSGDTNFSSGTNATVGVTVGASSVATTTAVTASTISLPFPNAPTLTATVNPNTVTGGTVTFKRVGIDVQGCVNLALSTVGANKTVSCTPPSASVPPGSHSFSAHYSGAIGFAASSGTSPTVTLTDSPAANNNTGTNTEANPVLVDLFYVHADHLGSPRVVSNPVDNKKVWEWDPTPFGETAPNENPQNSALPTTQFRYNLRFPGQFYDAETSKHYNYFRDYDSSTGRYVESDPIGLKSGPSTFGYSLQAPIRNRDLFGLFSVWDIERAWQHYCNGTGAPWSVPFDSINWGDTEERATEQLSKSLTGTRSSSGKCKPYTTQVNEIVDTKAGGADALVIGRHRVRLSGTAEVDCECKWSFKGNLSSAGGADPYDFDPSNRGRFGETLTAIGRGRCPGPSAAFPNGPSVFNIFLTGSKAVNLSGKCS
jgi:RHS repeat-associated protein